MENKEPVNLEKRVFAAIDFGSSLTKIACGRDSAEWKVFGIEPEIFPIFDEESLVNLGGQGSEINALWVEVTEDDGEKRRYALGNLANVMAKPTRNLRQPKYKSAVLKIMGALAVMLSQFPSLRGKQLNCYLACVLPPGEFNDREGIKNALESVLSGGFNSAVGFVKGRISYFDCKPEGGPLLLRYKKKHGMEAVEKKKITILMTGFRNLSMLYVVRTVAQKKISSELGYVQLLTEIKNKVTWLHGDDKLIETISRYQEGLSLNRDFVSDQEKFVNAFKSSEDIYYEKIRLWLRENVEPETNLILIGGGAAKSLRPILAEIFAGKEMYIHPAIIERVWEELSLKIEQIERYEDVLCLWEDLLGKHFKQTTTKNDEKKAKAGTKGN